MKKYLKKIKEIVKKFPEIKLIYLFGSRATGKEGPMSDYDFAIYLNEKDSEKRFDLRLKLIVEFSDILKTDNLDLLILNDTEMPELKYHIIKDGKLLYEEEPYKVIVEPLILGEYFDFYYSLKRFGLTQA